MSDLLRYGWGDTSGMHWGGSFGKSQLMWLTGRVEIWRLARCVGRSMMRSILLHRSRRATLPHPGEHWYLLFHVVLGHIWDSWPDIGKRMCLNPQVTNRTTEKGRNFHPGLFSLNTSYLFQGKVDQLISGIWVLGAFAQDLAQDAFDDDTSEEVSLKPTRWLPTLQWYQNKQKNWMYCLGTWLVYHLVMTTSQDCYMHGAKVGRKHGDLEWLLKRFC